MRSYVEQLNSEGVRLLNFWRQATTEAGHADVLLELLDLPHGASVVDLGCGTGEFARLAMRVRPDLKWTLVNTDEWQLSQAPEGARKVCGDLAATGLSAGCFDAVLLAYAVGHADLVAALEEAHLLLAVDGQLLIHDQFTDNEARQAAFAERLNYQLHGRLALVCAARAIGFDDLCFLPDEHLAPGPIVAQVHASGWLDGLEHGALAFRKSDRAPKFGGKRAALNFSGGKDSLACLYLLKPWVAAGRIAVYWTNTGDACPETAAVVQAVRALPWVREFREIGTDVVAWRGAHGMPSDVVPSSAHPLGLAYGMSAVAISNKFDCCMANIAGPMHERMLADGMDIVIRGTKRADTGKVPAEGPTEFYELLLPLVDWSHAEVFDYLARAGAPENPVYRYFKGISAPECMGCTAWWDDGKAAYLKALHPRRHGEYVASLRQIKDCLAQHLRELDAELSEE